ncbi:MAG: type II toxin-antitoxin system VapC family toxin [Gemmatimonadetes bacterium]|nr:type II toxin-antitoxin system VapC family toxin [Gemmatimonadota bacterium]
MSVYLDTSALAKWYLNEPRSAEFEEFLQNASEPTISSLVVVEMRCLLARRRRSGHFDALTEARIFAQFQEDLAQDFLHLRPLEDGHAFAAARLIDRLQPRALRTLDAMHLAVASAVGVEELATADGQMAEAAAALGLRVLRFD